MGRCFSTLSDRDASGRYLFLAGVTPSEEPYGAAVRWFQARHRRIPAGVLAGLLPRAFRRTPSSAWSSVTRAALLAWCGAPADLSGADAEAVLRRAGLWRPPFGQEPSEAPARRRLVERGWAALPLYLLLAALLGTGVLCYGVWHWLRESVPGRKRSLPPARAILG